jgi:caspase domain-containing protein
MPFWRRHPYLPIGVAARLRAESGESPALTTLKTFRRYSWVTALIAAACTSSCISYTSTSGTTTVSVTDTFIRVHTARLKSVLPVIGVFVGVSNYGVKANVPTRPAHTISAALLYEIFYNADPNKPPESELRLVRESQTHDNLQLLADLRLNPRTEGALAYPLNDISGIWDQFHPRSEKPDLMEEFFPRAKMARDGTWPYLGEGELVSRSRILAALTKGLADYTKAESSLFVFYISGHGGIADDGRPYIIPADANIKERSTLIFYDEVLTLIYAAKATRADDLDSSMLIIFDACQQLPATEVQARPILPPPMGVTVVQSASPGQAAWHFTTSQRTTGNQEISRDFRIGFPWVPSAARKGPFDKKMDASVGILPMAMSYALMHYVRLYDEMGSHPEMADMIPQILLDHWLEVTEDRIPDFLESAGFARDAQIVQIDRNFDDDELRDLFEVKPKP